MVFIYDLLSITQFKFLYLFYPTTHTQLNQFSNWKHYLVYLVLLFLHQNPTAQVKAENPHQGSGKVGKLP